ncbi:putative adenylosuccinate lyase [Rosa chinensis]|uniref:Putative adenylosuccinate lyase n=1 Tax=Rosa chinensis TaxID=74649 RepID=A0A2P6QDF1_ROSCH|nr:putative adenylosuccinate lyase [Rosa chinensis]
MVSHIYKNVLIGGFSISDAVEIKKIERETNHDVKVVLEFFHFACTSEDINNLARALMLEGAMNNVVIPFMDDLIQARTM